MVKLCIYFFAVWLASSDHRMGLINYLVFLCTVHSHSWQYYVLINLETSEEKKKTPKPRFKPRRAWWEAWMQPLCYADPQLYFNFVERTASTLSLLFIMTHSKVCWNNIEKEGQGWSGKKCRFDRQSNRFDQFRLQSTLMAIFSLQFSNGSETKDLVFVFGERWKSVLQLRVTLKYKS